MTGGEPATGEGTGGETGETGENQGGFIGSQSENEESSYLQDGQRKNDAESDIEGSSLNQDDQTS